MKGFFDTIPSELDESARVDGATPAQIFWGVVLPLAAPVLAVVGAALLHLHDQRVRDRERAAADDGHFDAAGRAARLHRQAVRAALGAVRGRRPARGDPGVILFMSLQRFIVGGLTQGSVKG